MRILLFFLCILLLPAIAHAQAMRYFQFSIQCGHGEWRDTSVVAATSNPAVIAEVLADMQKPIAERKMISGQIDYGDGGYNHNAGHRFLWHFVPNQWELVEMAVEVCDGCPYSDLDADTAYWVGNIGYYCPWSSKVAKEVVGTVDVDEPVPQRAIIAPNPVQTTLLIRLPEQPSGLILTVINSLGTVVRETPLRISEAVDVASLATGLYIAVIKDKTGSVLARHTFLKQ